MKSLLMACLWTCLMAAGCVGVGSATDRVAMQVNYLSNVHGRDDGLAIVEKTINLDLARDRKAIVLAMTNILRDADLTKPEIGVQFVWHVRSDRYEIRVRTSQTKNIGAGFRIFTGPGMLHVAHGIGESSKSKERFLESLASSLLEQRSSYVRF